MKILAMIFTFILCVQAGAEAMLRVRPHIIAAPGSVVKLSQLIDSQGLSNEMKAKLEAVSISVAPAYGEKQEIANAAITSILRPLIQEERDRTQSKLHLVIPKMVVIDTTKRELDAEMVRGEILTTWQPLCPDCQLEVEALSLPRIEGIHDWTLHLKAELPRGSFSIPVDLVRQDGSMTSAWVSGRLVTKRKVPVAKRMINMNERVTAQDFTWEFRDTSFSVDGVPTSDEFVGKRMKQGLRANEVLWAGMLVREVAVRRGDLVQLKSSEGAWEVTVAAVAQQDAFVGDVIGLKNPKTNTIFMGHVVGQGEVELR